MTMWYFQNEVFDPKPEQLDPKKDIGFVYLITNLVDGRKYIGKKLFFSSKTKQIKGKKKKTKVESDWRKYYGSNAAIQEDVQKLGESNFRREILYLCRSKSECSYWETKEIFVRDALLKSNDFYNEWVMCKIRSAHLGSLKNKSSQPGLQSSLRPDNHES